jgi:crotonobetaine/carnitine-CoA ligase
LEESLVITDTLTVGAALSQRAADTGETPFVKIEGQWFSAVELERRAKVIATGLTSLGVAKGDRVAVILPNCTQMLDIFFGCALLGAVLVPVNAWLKGTFLAYQLADSGASLLVADRAGLETAAPLLPELTVKQVVIVGDYPGEVPVPSARWSDVFDEHDTAAIDFTPDDVAPTDPMAIIYTSGTTGPSKGCVLSHGYYTATSRVIAERKWLEPGDRLLTAWPLFHTSGQAIALMSSLRIGASVVFEAGFSASTFMQTAVDNEATVMAGVGFMGAALLAQPPGPADRAHSCRHAWWIPMAPDQQLAFEQRFGITVLAEAFGQTEAFPITMSSIDSRRVRGSLGEASSHFEVRLVDDRDADVSPGQVGEIAVRPRFAHVMFSGYWGKPEATVEAWRNLWHHTGDLARADENGVLRFVDRKKDAVRRRGENISSVELEAAIGKHPAIAQVAVCAVQSDLGDDDVRAVLVIEPGAAVEPGELFDFLKGSLPYFAVPRYIDIVDALPVNALGRVMKHVIRATPPGAGTWDFEAIGYTVSKEERRGATVSAYPPK